MNYRSPTAQSRSGGEGEHAKILFTHEEKTRCGQTYHLFLSPNVSTPFSSILPSITSILPHIKRREGMSKLVISLFGSLSSSFSSKEPIFSILSIPSLLLFQLSITSSIISVSSLLPCPLSPFSCLCSLSSFLPLTSSSYPSSLFPLSSLSLPLITPSSQFSLSLSSSFSPHITFILAVNKRERRVLGEQIISFLHSVPFLLLPHLPSPFLSSVSPLLISHYLSLHLSNSFCVPYIMAEQIISFFYFINFLLLSNPYHLISVLYLPSSNLLLSMTSSCHFLLFPE